MTFLFFSVCLWTRSAQCATYLHYPGCPPRVWHVTAAWISRAYTPFVVCELPDFSWAKEHYSSFLSLVVLLPTKEKKKNDKKERKEESKKWQIQRDTQWGIVNQNIQSSLFKLCNKPNNMRRRRSFDSSRNPPPAWQPRVVRNARRIPKNVLVGGYWLINKEERFLYTNLARLCNTKPEKTRIASENTLVNALSDLLTVFTRISAAILI